MKRSQRISAWIIELLETRQLLAAQPGTFSAGLASGGGTSSSVTLPFLSASELPATGTYNEFINADGVSGDATDSRYAGDIQATSFAFGVQNSPADNGASATRGTPDSLQFISSLGSQSTTLMSDVATGAILSNLTLHVVQAGASGNEVYQVKLTDVIVASYEAADTTETWSVSYDKIEVTYTPYNTDGTAGTPVTGGYDFETNQADVATQASAVTGAAADPVEGGRSLVGETTVPDPNNSPDPVLFQLDGINGNSTRVGYGGYFEADALGFGLGRSSDTGEAEIENVRISLPLGIESPTLLADAAAGKHITSATIDEITPGDAPYTPLALGLTDVTIVDDQVVSGREVFELQYAKITVTTTHQNVDGSLASPTTFTFDSTAAGSATTLPVLSIGDVTPGNGFQEFANIDGITGDSTNSQFAGQVPIDDFAFGLQHVDGASAPTVDSFEFTSDIGTQSTSLMSDLATDKHISTISLSLIAAETTSEVVERIVLNDAVIAGYEAADTTETWSVTYGKIEITCTPYDSSGNAGTPVIGGFDTTQNTQDGGRSLAGATAVPDPSYSANPVLVDIDGINGGSTRTGYSDFIEADALGFGMGVDPSTGDTQFENIRISAPLGVEAPLLLVDYFTAKVIPSVTIDELSSGGTVYTPLTLELTNVTVVDDQVVSGREVFELKFAKIEVKTVHQNQDGSLSSPNIFAEDVEASSTAVATLPVLSIGDVEPAGAYQEFVTATGIEGDSTDANFVGAIDINDFAFGFENNDAGDAAADSLQLTSVIGSQSASLMSDVASGTIIPTLTLTLTNDSDSSQKVFKVVLNNAVIDTYETADTDETWSVSYAKIETSYYAASGTIIGGFDVPTNDPNVAADGSANGGRSLAGETTLPDPDNSSNPVLVQFDGVNGDSTRPGFNGYLEADALGFGLGAVTSDGVTRTQFENIRLSLPLQVDAPTLYQDAASGQNIAGVVIDELQAGSNTFVPLEFQLSDVKVVDEQVVNGREVLELSYGQIQVLTNQTIAVGGTVSGTVIGGVTGETIYLDGNNDGSLDNSELSTPTGNDGSYEFDNVPAGSYVVRQVLPAGYEQTSPAGNAGISIVVTPGGVDSGENFTDAVLADITVTAPDDQSATAGVSESFELGSFTASNATAPFTVDVNWGDGSADSVFKMAAAGVLTSQFHTYTGAGDDRVSITVTDFVNNVSNTATFTADVSPAPVGGTVSGTVTDGPAGETIFLDANNDGSLDDGELSTTTLGDGSYSFSAVPAGAYIITQSLPAGYTQTSPANDRGILISVTNGSISSGDNFTNTTLANITGSVAGGLAGETIYLDTNNNSTLDGGELSTTLNSNGTYGFVGVPAGAYIIRQVLPAAYTQTSPTRNYGLHLTVANGTSIAGQNFADAAPGSVSGTVAGATAGVTVYLDANNNGSLDGAELSTTTQANGFYQFPAVPIGSYIVRQVLPTGLSQVVPSNNYGDHLTVTASATVTNQNFTDVAAPTSTPRSGVTIGTPGSFNNSGNTINNATDGNLSTFFDAAESGGAWVGLDLGSSVSISQIAFAPRSGYASRMVGGAFQISTTADFSSGVTTIYTITTAPPAGLTTITLASPVTMQYIRYVGALHSHTNISEFEVFG